MHPAIIFRNKFVYEWNINGDENFSGGDYIDYMLRPEAFQSELHRLNTDQFYGFEEFMDTEEVSDGLFSSDYDLMNESQISRVRELENISRANGCPKYIGVMSFDNNYLRTNNILVGKNLNVQKLKDAARKGMNALIETSDKLDPDNCYWVASIHTNAKHIHIHYQLLEYERTVDRQKEDLINKDKIEVKAFRKLKSTVMYNIDNDDKTQRITKFERDILQKQLKYNFANSVSQIDELIKKLPDDKGWQYNRLRKNTKNQIDSVVRTMIRSDEKINEDYTEYIRQLDDASQLFKKRYGKKSHWAEYKMNRLHGKDGFYSRVGNSFLNLCKEYKKNGEIDLTKLDKPTDYVMHKNIEGKVKKSEKLLDDEDAFDIKADDILDNNLGKPLNVEIEFLDDIGNRIDYENESYEQFPEFDEPDISENIEDYESKELPYNGKTHLSKNKNENADDFFFDDTQQENLAGKKNFNLSKNENPLEDEIYTRNDLPYNGKSYLSKNKNEMNEPQPFIAWSKEYKAALDYLYGNEKSKIEKNPQKALELLTAESDKGNILATYDVGKMYANEIVKVDEHTAFGDKYYSKALSDFNELLNKDIFLLESKTDKKLLWEVSYLHYRIGKMYDRGLGTEQDYETARLHYEQARENKYALFSLGNMYKYGNGVEIDTAKAFEYYQQSENCKGEMPYASYNLGQAYENGDGVEQSDEKAKAKYSAALNGFINIFAKNPDDSTSYKIGYMYFYGKGTEIDYEQAEKYLIKSADVNNLNAQCLLGKLYMQLGAEKFEQAKDSLKKSEAAEKLENDGDKLYQKAEKVLKAAAENTTDKNGLGSYSLGKLYMTDEKQDYQLAEKYLKISADKDNLYAQYSLGKFYQMDNYKDFDKTEKYLVLSAENATDKDGLGAYGLGKLYMSDEKQDYKAAYRYLKKSADKGNMYGQYSAGKLLLDNGASADEQMAVKLLEESDRQGCEPACYTLGKYYLYLDGKDSQNKAYSYFYKSAIDNNNSYAQYNLGKMYLDKNDKKTAEEFFKMSAENNNDVGQLAYGLFLYKQGKKVQGRQWLKASAQNGNEFAAKILKNSTNGIPLKYQLKYLSVNQKIMMSKSSNLLRKAISDERAKTQRLMNEFEREQDKRLMQEQKRGIEL